MPGQRLVCLMVWVFDCSLAQVVSLTDIPPAPHANSGYGANPTRLQTGTHVIPPELAMFGWHARVQAANQDVSMQSLDKWHRGPKYPLTGHAAGGHHTLA